MKFKSIINDICCDHRIRNGIFDISNTDHVFILQEYLEKDGYELDDILNKTARLFEAGKFPERQAYNKNGILVTFPTKEYKSKAVDKGTHFVENPKKSKSNIFLTPDPESIYNSDTTDTTTSDTSSDVVSIDSEVESTVDDGSSDTRTSDEKLQDGEVVKNILTTEPSQMNYSVDEAKNMGFYKKGFLWYNIDGKLIGEQIFDEKCRLFKILSTF